MRTVFVEQGVAIARELNQIARFAGRLAVVIGAALAGCHYARSEVIVSVRTDIATGAGSAIQGVRVTIRAGGPGGAVQLEREYRKSGLAHNFDKA